ncbi:heme oxygenase [Staphylococcus succinus]|uniref:heme oxygenase n=1 Tax=Staphylococcus succinus TaxID=61015 RepID=UPI000E6A07A6|nr:heme oxygenase [Staphylococcus succinus]RIN29662.1 heme oxygenase [Staphylococcus succinus]
MYVVTNSIELKKGFDEKMAPHFTQGGKIQELKGFKKIEVWQVDEDSDHDQMYVNTWWETQEDFNAWLKSDAFKEAHSGKSKSEEGESPVIGNKVVKANVLSTLN